MGEPERRSSCLRGAATIVTTSLLAALAASAPACKRAPRPSPAPASATPAMETAAALKLRLDAALRAQGPGYVPRTRHKNPDGSPRYTNRLILETSPYLLQHAHNPVDWHAWGDEAFAEARRRGVPVFLSVGYSTCHWCHVMEVESFEDEEIARTMNDHYVCIKVDREERPDVDAIYMSAVQALTGSGGWPMNVWLTPEREPFFGGTYFPPRDGVRGARRGFLTLLRELADRQRTDPAGVKREAATLATAVRQELQGEDAQASSAASELPPASIIPRLAASLQSAFDEENGGLRRAPKFPSNLPIRLLLRANRRAGDAEALRMATVTLAKMAAGGIHDQIGGGFHRYSTDAAWLVPHFEKMLYDNALLAVAYVEAHQVTGRADFARVARDTLDYVLREMTSPDGGFFSATDADSAGGEGAFFVWSEAEIRALLGGARPTAATQRLADRFVAYYGVTPGGNFDGGRNILHVASPSEAETAALAGARAILYAARARREPPARDEKVVAGWNGLMISALAQGGAVLGEERYVDAAARAAEFVVTKMRVGGKLMRSFKDGRGAGAPLGYLEDYAFVAAGLFDLYEASFDARWLREALALVAATEALFADGERGGWFMTSDRHEKLLARERPSYDGATPSGTSVAMMNALRAATFTGEERWRVVADRALASYRGLMAERPLAMTDALLALDYRTDAVREIAIVWPAGAGDEAKAAAPLLAVLRRTFVPNRVVAAGAEGADVAAAATFVEGKRAAGGRATAYVCDRGRCELPTGDPRVFARQLGKSRAY
jgi:uncharacterized protein YyaL (SSP411 family)